MAGMLVVGDLAGREDDQAAAGLEPAQGRAEPFEIGANRGFASEGIHGNQAVAQGCDAIEEVIAQNTGIRTDPLKQVAQDDAFSPAEGMIGHHDQRATGRYFGKIFGSNQIGHAQKAQHPAESRTAGLPRGQLHVQVVDRPDARHPFQHAIGHARCQARQRMMKMTIQMNERFVRGRWRRCRVVHKGPCPNGLNQTGIFNPNPHHLQ